MLSPTLYQFFHRQLEHGFRKRGLDEPDTVDYISDILTRFAHNERLYLIRDSDGKPLEYLYDLQNAWRLAQGAEGGRASRAQERQIIKHIGEYSLFMSGLFKQRLESRGELHYYIANGSSAFWHCADHEHGNPKHHQLFRRLHYNFSHIVGALDRLRRNNFTLQPMEGQLHPATALWRL